MLAVAAAVINGASSDPRELDFVSYHLLLQCSMLNSTKKCCLRIFLIKAMYIFSRLGRNVVTKLCVNDCRFSLHIDKTYIHIRNMSFTFLTQLSFFIVN